MNLKKRLILSCSIVLLLFTGFTTYYVNNIRSKKISNEQVISKQKHKLPKRFIDKKTAEQINRKFYSHEKVQAGAEMSFVKYPSTFSKLVASGQLTIIGEITDLKSYVSNSQPYTIANVGVRQVLHGDKSKQNKTIRVMFLGGNITKKEMLAPVADKKFMGVSKAEASSDEVVTIEYSNNRLPKAGEKIAMIISKSPKGANNIPGEFWDINFANKSTFFQDDDGLYRRIPEAKSFGGGSDEKSSGFSENDWNEQDDKKMNDGMNELIKSKLKK